LQTILSITFLIGFTIVLARRVPALWLFLSGTSAILLFSLLRRGDLRHHGHYFLVFALACWLAGLDDLERGAPSTRLTDGARARGLVMSGILAVQALAGVLASCLDVAYPFSASGAAARWLAVSQWTRLPIVGDRDTQAVAVAAQLRQPFFLPMGNRWSTFVRYDGARGSGAASPRRTLDVANQIAKDRHSDVILVLNYPLSSASDRELLMQFVRSAVPTETFFIYRLSASRHPARR
jgi:hypothetical protein